MKGNNDIRYVCLSDLHLGEEDSLLTGVSATGECDPLNGPVPVLDGLVARLADLIGDQTEKPTLVLLGDVLELALATDNVAAMAFERFIDLTFNRSRLFDGIVYVPGNHDHHVWESARETQYVQNYLMGIKTDPVTGASSPRAPLGSTLNPSWHTTSMFILEDPERQATGGIHASMAAICPEAARTWRQLLRRIHQLPLVGPRVGHGIVRCVEAGRVGPVSGSV